LTDLHEQARTAQGALSTEIEQNILKFEEKKKVITAASSCGLNAALRNAIFNSEPEQIDEEMLSKLLVVMKSGQSKSKDCSYKSLQKHPTPQISRSGARAFCEPYFPGFYSGENSSAISETNGSVYPPPAAFFPFGLVFPFKPQYAASNMPGTISCHEFQKISDNSNLFHVADSKLESWHTASGTGNNLHTPYMQPTHITQSNHQASLHGHKPSTMPGSFPISHQQNQFSLTAAHYLGQLGDKNDYLQNESFGAPLNANELTLFNFFRSKKPST